MHLDYESVEPYELTETWHDEAPEDDTQRYYVEKLDDPKTRVDGKPVPDRTRLIVNRWLTLEDIPERAHEYLIGTRSAVDWLVDRYKVKVDSKSGVQNDPNDWAHERGEPSYIADLVKRVVTVSLATLDVVESLPNSNAASPASPAARKAG